MNFSKRLHSGSRAALSESKLLPSRNKLRFTNHLLLYHHHDFEPEENGYTTEPPRDPRPVPSDDAHLALVQLVQLPRILSPADEGNFPYHSGGGF
ncbi:hypothetical protein Hypma_013203 [Hypsizygus marmoreus]|uniref:Uncharacterized protein n=1 Tax=Hypsizygus marmoreus TaxID=39966 RepID=A0A369JEZ6_HYPMA|nr:hypothetical protein Hypma_013203 [Hypsizygus marmoreus]